MPTKPTTVGIYMSFSWYVVRVFIRKIVIHTFELRRNFYFDG